MTSPTLAFDFDQTLVSTYKGVLKAIEVVLVKKDIEFSIEQLHGRLNLPLNRIFDPWSPQIDARVAQSEFMDIYPDLSRLYSEILPGAEDAIKYFKSLDFDIIIVSAKQERNLEILIKHLQLDVQEFYGNCYKERKTEILQRRKAIAYVGDHPDDVNSARNTPCKSIITLTGFSKIEEFAIVKPDLILKNLIEHKEIYKLIANDLNA